MFALILLLDYSFVYFEFICYFVTVLWRYNGYYKEWHIFNMYNGISLDMCKHPPYHYHGHNRHIPHFPEFPFVALFCFVVGRTLNMRSVLLTNF